MVVVVAAQCWKVFWAVGSSWMAVSRMRFYKCCGVVTVAALSMTVKAATELEE